jgi:hypothetical protein
MYVYMYFFLNFRGVGWVEIESSRYIYHCLAYCDQSRMIDGDECWSVVGMRIGKVNFAYYKSHITRDRTRTSAVESRRLAALNYGRARHVISLYAFWGGNTSDLYWGGPGSNVDRYTDYPDEGIS